MCRAERGSAELPRYAELLCGLFFTIKTCRVAEQLCATRLTIRDGPLHCEDSAEPCLAFRNASVSLLCLCQRIRLDHRFNFSLRHEIERFVEIFGAVLLAANESNAL